MANSILKKQYLRQEGYNSSVGNGAWRTYNVTFPIPYSAKPIVTVSHSGSTASENISLSGEDITPTGFTYHVYTPATNWTYETYWQAFGEL